ncbi:hypothetical protein [Bacillus sp. UMB0728]|uniref:hypothetical protein n=1 Tax=Bacillus sp. UMB0728 TaxID=2066052 RepID=UPI000C78E63F|nr:hypothetical protein [Bacillus sp. UMB0728]PLR72221.1 hypothetical protein CYJ37_11745 [Bacillus sp. UMB0728]
MKNIAQIVAQLHMVFETSLSEDSLLNSFHPDVIIGAKVEITLPDGSVHTTSIATINELSHVSYENNSDEDEYK